VAITKQHIEPALAPVIVPDTFNVHYTAVGVPWPVALNNFGGWMISDLAAFNRRGLINDLFSSAATRGCAVRRRQPGHDFSPRLDVYDHPVAGTGWRPVDHWLGCGRG